MPPDPCPPHVYVTQEVTIKGKPQMVTMSSNAATESRGLPEISANNPDPR